MTTHTGRLLGLEIDAELLISLAGTTPPATDALAADFVLISDDSAALGAADRTDAAAVVAAAAAIRASVPVVPTVDLALVEPFNVAREIATLDILSDGNAGLALSAPLPHERALRSGTAYTEDAADPEYLDEAVEAIRLLWTSWEPDALVRDWENNQFLDSSLVHAIDYRGKHLRIRGPLATPRSPQGRAPIFFLADPSSTSTRLPVGATTGPVDVVIGSPEQLAALSGDGEQGPLRLSRLREGENFSGEGEYDGVVVTIASTPASWKDLAEESTRIAVSRGWTSGNPESTTLTAALARGRS